MNRIYVLFIRGHIFLSLEPPHTKNLILTDIRSQHKYFGANGGPHLIIPLKSKFQKTWSSQWPLVRWVVSKLLLWCALGKQVCQDLGGGGGVFLPRGGLAFYTIWPSHYQFHIAGWLLAALLVIIEEETYIPGDVFTARFLLHLQMELDSEHLILWLNLNTEHWMIWN